MLRGWHYYTNERWNGRLMNVPELTLSESVRHSSDAELGGSLLSSFKHPLDVLGIVSI